MYWLPSSDSSGSNERGTASSLFFDALCVLLARFDKTEYVSACSVTIENFEAFGLVNPLCRVFHSNVHPTSMSDDRFLSACFSALAGFLSL